MGLSCLARSEEKQPGWINMASGYIMVPELSLCSNSKTASQSEGARKATTVRYEQEQGKASWEPDCETLVDAVPLAAVGRVEISEPRSIIGISRFMYP